MLAQSPRNAQIEIIESVKYYDPHIRNIQLTEQKEL